MLKIFYITELVDSLILKIMFCFKKSCLLHLLENSHTLLPIGTTELTLQGIMNKTHPNACYNY